MSYTDKNGKTIDGGYAVKVGDDYYAATPEKDGSFSINTTSYTAADGTSKTALNQLGGADGKTEVVTIDGKTYNASKAAGHDFKAQPELAEAAAKTTENPLQKIDAALAQVDTLRSDLGAVQNRFNSAITNLGNTVNNLTSARSRIEDSDYATEVSNMSSRADSAAGGGLPFWRRLTRSHKTCCLCYVNLFSFIQPRKSGLFHSA
ncbi:Phase 2 flagellin [Salmonella enterica subsp. arizonae]|nr:Phase 2 flagellin [Salmonella enterica subsp. arizonae]